MKRETIIAIVSAAAAIGSGVVAFMSQQKAADAEARMALVSASADTASSVRDAIFEKRFELYFEIAELTARIATATDEQTRQDAETRFRELYWGQLIIVEEADIQSAVMAFRDALETGAHRDQLKQRSQAVARAIRATFMEDWEEHVGDVDAVRSP